MCSFWGGTEDMAQRGVDSLPCPVPVLDAGEVVLCIVGGRSRFHRFAEFGAGGVVQYIYGVVRRFAGEGHQFRQI